MKLLASPKQLYLLQAGLDVLHQECSEWLDEIAFWRDEAVFLYHLVERKLLELRQVNAGAGVERIENELLRLSAKDIDALRDMVMKHEVYLSKLLDSQVSDLESYRNRHHELSLMVMEFSKRFRELKKEVFNLSER